MNDLISTPANLPTAYELNSMSAQSLRAELAKSLTITAQHLRYLAAIWAELEKRGEDLGDFRVGLAVYLPAIAAGRLDADAVVRFAGQQTVLRSLAGLPLERQKALAQGQAVDVATINAETGKIEVIELPAYALSASQARLVFDGDQIVGPEQQRAKLQALRAAKSTRANPVSGGVIFDPKSDTVKIGRARVSVGEILGAIAASRVGDEPAEDDLKSVVFFMTSEEHVTIKTRAAEAGISMRAYTRGLIRRALLL